VTNYLLDLKKAQTSTEQARALELFYNETAHLVFSFCRKKGITQQDGEDITQIVYTQIYNKREKYKPDYSPLAWLFVITKSEAKDYRKKSANYAEYLKDYGLFVNMSQNLARDPSTVQETRELDLSALSSKEKQAIEDRYFNEKEFTEIAKTLGVTDSNARKIISRAIRKLKG